MGCKTEERDGRQKVYLDMERKGQNRAKNEPFKLGAFGKGMLDNDTYNLMEQLEIESRSLWRIQNDYKNDASTNNESKQLWNLIEKDKEKIVRILTEKVRERL
jgi:hypothetical protein